VVLRLSKLAIRTRRDDPADVVLPGHAAMVRAGYLRPTGGGGHAWLPLGHRIHRRVERVVREEVARVGAQEIRLPTDADAVARLVRDLCASYRDLPLVLSRFWMTHDADARPGAGPLRARESVVQASSAFDLDDAAAAATYQRHRDAHLAIVTRLGLEAALVAATPASGDAPAETLLVPTPVGEDAYVRSPGGYAATVEAAVTPPPPPSPWHDAPGAHVEDTPDTPTIATLVAHANDRLPRPDRPWQPADTLKHVVVVLRAADGTRAPLVIGLPGDREVDLRRLQARVAPAVVEPFTDADVADHPAIVPGYLGPQVLGAASRSGIRYLVDPRVVPGTRWVTGANAPGRHVFDLVCGRDFVPDGTIEAAEVRPGDPAPDGSGPLEHVRGIALGHLVRHDRSHAEALGLQVLDASGRRVPLATGSYRFQVTRALAAIAETAVDDRGTCWPRAVAPADVHVVVVARGAEAEAAGERLAAELATAGPEVLLDDRPGLRPGVRFRDAELLGVPTVAIVGRALVDGLVEVEDRRSGQRVTVPLEAAVDRLVAMCAT
jgi:prolyl-tRNA synthetase